jgi:hypothetical protein
MVDSVHRIFTEGRKAVDLRFIIGSSLGCIHSLMWAEIYPDSMDGIVGLSQPVEISGRNWIMPRAAAEASATIRTFEPVARHLTRLMKKFSRKRVTPGGSPRCVRAARHAVQAPADQVS